MTSIFKALKAYFSTIVGFTVSGILLYLTFRLSGLEYKKLVLDGRQWGFFTASCLAFCVSVYVQSLRAKLFWTGTERNNTLVSLVIGNFYSCLLPSNLGDGVRAWHFSRRNNISLSRSLSALVAEKWIDSQIFIPGVIILFTVRPFKGTYIAYAILYTALTAFILSLIYGLMRRNRPVEKFLWQIVLIFKKPAWLLFKLYWQTTQHLKNLKERGLMGYYIVLCGFMILPNMAQFFFLFKCANIPDVVGNWYTSYFLMGALMILIFIPSAPSNAGVMHYGIYSALISASAQCNFKPDNTCLQNFALYAVLLHLSFVIPDIIIGAIFLIKERKTVFSELKREP